MNDDDALLERVARDFADRLTATVHCSVGDGCAPFVAELANGAAVVKQSPATGIPLALGDGSALTLVAGYHCVLDSHGERLRVQASRFAVYFGDEAAGEPLFRYDYDGNGTLALPRAHLQVGDSGDLRALVALSGDHSKRARNRQSDVDAGRRMPRADDLHFPVGGDRFRPALEDVLQLLVDALGVPAQAGWRQVLAAGRMDWRERQLASAVRDNPPIAAAALAELGYVVQPPPSGHPRRRMQHLTGA